MKLSPNHERSWDFDLRGGWASVTWESCHPGALVAVLKDDPSLSSWLLPLPQSEASGLAFRQKKRNQRSQYLASCALCSS